jgi:hypothetical protein
MTYAIIMHQHPKTTKPPILNPQRGFYTLACTATLGGITESFIIIT